MEVVVAVAGVLHRLNYFVLNDGSDWSMNDSMTIESHHREQVVERNYSNTTDDCCTTDDRNVLAWNHIDEVHENYY